MSEEFPYFYAWNRMDRKGQACRVLARGKMNSCCVQFEDGFKAITSRNAIRRRLTGGRGSGHAEERRSSSRG